MESLPAVNFQYAVNPLTGTWEPMRALSAGQLTQLASAARAASINGTDQTNYSQRGGHFRLNITANASAVGITFHLQGKDTLSNVYYDLLVGTPIITTGLFIYKLYPGIAASPNAAAADILPPTWRVQVIAGDALSVTYSISCALMP